MLWQLQTNQFSTLEEQPSRLGRATPPRHSYTAATAQLLLRCAQRTGCGDNSCTQHTEGCIWKRCTCVAAAQFGHTENRCRHAGSSSPPALDGGDNARASARARQHMGGPRALFSEHVIAFPTISLYIEILNEQLIKSNFKTLTDSILHCQQIQALKQKDLLLCSFSFLWNE